MTYDYHGGWESVTGYNTPLYSPQPTIYTVDASVQYWIQQTGSKKNLLLLGLAFYGQSWTTSGNKYLVVYLSKINNYLMIPN